MVSDATSCCHGLCAAHQIISRGTLASSRYTARIETPSACNIYKPFSIRVIAALIISKETQIGVQYTRGYYAINQSISYHSKIYELSRMKILMLFWSLCAKKICCIEKPLWRYVHFLMGGGFIRRDCRFSHRDDDDDRLVCVCTSMTSKEEREEREGWEGGRMVSICRYYQRDHII